MLIAGGAWHQIRVSTCRATTELATQSNVCAVCCQELARRPAMSRAAVERNKGQLPEAGTHFHSWPPRLPETGRSNELMKRTIEMIRPGLRWQSLALRRFTSSRATCQSTDAPRLSTLE